MRRKEAEVIRHADVVAAIQEIGDSAAEVLSEDKNEAEEGEQGEEAELEVLAATKEAVPCPVMLSEAGDDEDDEVDDEKSPPGAQPSLWNVGARAAPWMQRHESLSLHILIRR